MAEPIGLAVGIAGLAGLFSSCLEAFSLINTAQDFGVDYEILCIKLDIEKTRLLQWAQGTDFLSDDPDNQNQRGGLSLPDSQQQVERILTAIKLLLTNSHDLELKYGLRSDHRTSVDGKDAGTLAVSSTRARTFEAAFCRFQNGIPLRQKDSSLGTRLKWVIKDRDKFECLLRNLHQLTSGLIDLVALPRYFRRLLVKEDIDTLQNDISNLRLIQAASQGQDDEWNEIASMQVEASQQATQDFRTLEEWLQDVEDRDRPSTISPSSTPDIGIESRTLSLSKNQAGSSDLLDIHSKITMTSPRTLTPNRIPPVDLGSLTDPAIRIPNSTVQEHEEGSSIMLDQLALPSSLESSDLNPFAPLKRSGIDIIRGILMKISQFLNGLILESDGLRNDKPNVGVFKRIIPELSESIYICHFVMHSKTEVTDAARDYTVYALNPEKFRLKRGILELEKRSRFAETWEHSGVDDTIWKASGFPVRFKAECDGMEVSGFDNGYELRLFEDGDHWRAAAKISYFTNSRTDEYILFLQSP